MVSSISKYSIMKSLFKISLVIFSILFIVGCAATRKKINESEPIDQTRIPPGVDSLLAVKADSLSDLLFVNYAQKVKSINYHHQSRTYFHKGDSLWQLYQNLSDCSIVSTAKDSNFALNYYLQCRCYLKLKNKKIEKHNQNLNEIKQVALALVRKAKIYADSANVANPQDLNIRVNLSQVLMKLGELSGKKSYYRDSIKKLKDILTCEKSLHNIYSLLGECYYALSDWDNSYSYFHQAQQVLKYTSVLQNLYSQSCYLDTTKLVYYLYQQGDTKAKLYDDKRALQLFKQALLISHSPSTRQQIREYIDWINWDDGNILAVEMRDQVYSLYQQKKYKKAKKKFKKLLKILKTQRNKDLINWRIATIDFEILNNEKNGIKRMFNIISSLNPKDSTAIVYLNDYGSMCYALGIDYLKKREYKIAYTYFNQAAKLNWDKHAESYLQLAQLSQSDPEETITKCQQVLADENRLSSQLLSQTYELLVHAYKRNGNFELARKYYNRLMQKSD